MPADVWDEIVRLRDRQFARWVTELRDGVTALGSATPAGARMADTVRYFEFLSAEMSSMLARWHDHHGQHRIGEIPPGPLGLRCRDYQRRLHVGKTGR